MTEGLESVSEKKKNREGDLMEFSRILKFH